MGRVNFSLRFCESYISLTLCLEIWTWHILETILLVLIPMKGMLLTLWLTLFCVWPWFVNAYRSAGFTIEEREDFSKVLSPSTDGNNLPGLIDSWRHFHPETKGHYTYYSYRFQCRQKLIGWRLDYFVVTPDLLDKIVESEIRQEVWGASDHVPLVLVIKDVNLKSSASSTQENNSPEFSSSSSSSA